MSSPAAMLSVLTPPVSIEMIGVPTGTVVPSSACSAVTTPANGDGSSTAAFTVSTSAIVSLTLVPSLCAVFLRAEKAPKPGSLSEKSEHAFDWVIARYDRGLGWVLAHQGLTLIVAVATFLVTAGLYLAIPKGLFPTQDTGQLQARVEAPQSVSYTEMASLQQQAARAIMEDPDLDTLSSFVGVDATNNTMLHTGRMLINLKPSHDRQDSIIQNGRTFRINVHYRLPIGK